MKLNKTLILASTAFAGLAVATGAFAQSTATQDLDAPTQEVVIRGNKATGPIRRESGPKAKATIDQGTISKSTAGQTIIETLNLVPGYNFTNNDAFGSSGGNIMMRGLNGDRVSLTVDGTQLNDSGNYAIYSNQQMESELICSATVQTGATDVDSMSASATGGTINYTTCKPEDEMGGVVKVSLGSQDFKQLFVRLDSGKFGPWGTKAFFAYSGQSYDTWTREPNVDPDINPHLQKNQYNFRIYQDLGDEGSFMSLSGHWNENRNHFQFGPSTPQRECDTNTAVGGSAGNVAPFCGYDYSSINAGNINPSNTGNLRGQSKWVLSDKLTLTVDPTFQYTLANGGGNSTLAENSPQLRGANYGTVAGVNLNGDSDVADTITIYRPNTTNTHRYSVNSSLIYQVTDSQIVRFGASFDRARHRQTGEATLVDENNAAIDVFGGRTNHDLRIKTADGSYWKRRDRLSKANVDVFSFEYRGRFFDDALFVSFGVRDQKLTRELNQFCYSPINGTGSTAPYCTTQVPTNSVTMSDGVKVVAIQSSGTNAATTSLYFSPYSRTVSFKKTLPNMGLTYRINEGNQVFFTYAQSMSSPRTDSYYGAVFDTPIPTTMTLTNSAQLTTNSAWVQANALSVANPEPETSETIELGYRYRAPTLQGTATFFSAVDDNRIIQAFDRDSGASFDRNVGQVKRNGFEGSAAWTPLSNLVLNGSVTYTDAVMQNNLEYAKTATGVGRYLMTKGKQLTEMPKWMATAGVNYQATSRLNVDVTAKYVGDRFTTDVNDEVAEGFVKVDAAVRYDLPFLKQGTYLQLNVVNLLDEQYLGSITSQNNAFAYTDNTGAVKNGTRPFINVGAPRTFVLSLRTAF
ncbi:MULTISPECIES: TonB-dependent receptor [Asticcacaulis]|uniref:TonB-dependent receptor n=1 Tax=Asticcacaulis TaxID=76890 RepID=UPI001AE56FE6|nr:MULTISPECIES: TonB-dependent receptor [Asticcacaulis]MBP2159539.1 iron complex outermembrane receptor protein [Asticcacaulis solisilvae]MDR6800634.1 iron complex outermembrane receptor protein [Asticcacaulis sp. BE141]